MKEIGTFKILDWLLTSNEHDNNERNNFITVSVENQSKQNQAKLFIKFVSRIYKILIHNTKVVSK
jgi:hypothetical protein